MKLESSRQRATHGASVSGVVFVIASSLMLPFGARSEPSSSQCERAWQRIPVRAPSAPSGSEFARRVASLDERERDAAIRAELLAGNLPSFLHPAVPIELAGRAADGARTRVTLCVLPDYLSIGSDRDFLLIPMSLATALAVADAFGFTLPTRKIVDAIYRQAAVHLSPQPLPAGDEMRSTGYYLRHNELVREQRDAIPAPLGALTAGDKKDLVITKLLWSTPGRVAIYGWHRGPDAPIQPLSIFHGARYADYSHGVRLVSAIAYVDGRARSIFELLRDPRLSPLLSDEGPLPLLDGLASLASGSIAALASASAAH